MAKTHFDPISNGRTLSTISPLHKTAYSGGINGIEVSNAVSEVDCKVCIKVMLSPDWRPKFTFHELELLSQK